MPTAHKEEIVEQIKDRFAESPSVIFADYRGLSVKELEQLRVQFTRCRRRTHRLQELAHRDRDA